MSQDPTVSQSIPTSIFDTDDLQPSDRLAAWRDSFDVAYDYRLDKTVDPRREFRARIENYLFDHFMLVNFKASAAVYDRPLTRIAQDGVDMVMVQMYEHGPCQFLMPDQEHRHCHADDVVIMDMSRPMKTRHPDQHNLTLCVPRALLADYVPNLDPLHLTVLPGQHALTKVLKAHMRSLYWGVQQLDAQDAHLVTRPTMETVAAAIRSALGDSVDFSSPVQTAQRARAEEIIGSQLGNPKLEIDQVAAQVPCARSRLFELFEDEGGVQSYVRRRRLKAALRDLAAPEKRDWTIIQIANQWGFENQSSFNRAFKSEFGLTPSEARFELPRGFLRRKPSYTRRESHERLYEDWIRGVLSSNQRSSAA